MPRRLSRHARQTTSPPPACYHPRAALAAPADGPNRRSCASLSLWLAPWPLAGWSLTSQAHARPCSPRPHAPTPPVAPAAC